MDVIYKDVPWAVGYRVGNDGSVWSRRLAPRGLSDEWHVLKPVKQQEGYVHVQLGRNKQTAVHRLVLTVFVGPCPHGMLAAHGNGIRDDNRLDNLRWATPTENEADKVEHGTRARGETQGLAKLTEKAVVELRSRAADGEGDSSLSRRFGVSRATIHAARKGKTWKHI